MSISMVIRKQALAVALCLAILSGCSAKLTNLEDVGENEVVAIGKFRIIYNGKDVTSGSNIIFNPTPVFGTPQYQNFLDDTGYIYTRLPVGLNSISLIVHKSGLIQRGFKPTELTIAMDRPKSIYYIGDITIRWNGVGAGTALVLVAAGPGQVPAATAGTISISVESSKEEAAQAFRRKFPNDRDILTSLMVVKPAP